jgi:hypothetical protein
MIALSLIHSYRNEISETGTLAADLCCSCKQFQVPSAASPLTSPLDPRPEPLSSLSLPLLSSPPRPLPPPSWPPPSPPPLPPSLANVATGQPISTATKAQVAENRRMRWRRIIGTSKAPQHNTPNLIFR